MANTPGPVPVCRTISENFAGETRRMHLFEPTHVGQVPYLKPFFSRGESGPAAAARVRVHSHNRERSFRGARPCRRAEAGLHLIPSEARCQLKSRKIHASCADAGRS